MKAEGGQRQATAQRIIDATRALMTEKGVLEVSIAEISQRASANVALVSYYFGNREGLMVAVVEADSRHALAGLERLLAADLSSTAKIALHIRGLIEAYFERPYLHRLLQKLVREASAETSARICQSLLAPVAAARRQIIGEGIRRGEFQPVDIDLVHFALDGACSQIFSSVEGRQAVLGGGRLNRDLIDRYAETVSTLVIAGLSNPSPNGITSPKKSRSPIKD